MTLTERKEYGDSLASMGFNYHNIIRFRRYDKYISKDSIVPDLSSDKLFSKQLDWYMNNLSKQTNIEYVWACIEPDIEKETGYVFKNSNNIHFAYKGKHLSKNTLANYMRINRGYLRDTEIITDSMSYFTKHIGKSLSYHNLYY